MEPIIKLPVGLRILRRVPMPHKLGVLGRMYSKALAKQGVAWVKTHPGPVWKLDLNNSTHRWIVFGDYEGPGFISWASRWITENSVVVDSGANIGQVLLYLAPQVGSSGRYHAFEPHPVAREWLKKCLERYPEWRVQLEPFGLGRQGGFASLAGQWGGEQAVGSHTELAMGGGDIEVVQMDDYVKRNGISTIDLWKLDMEGGEMAALEGAKEILRRQAVRSLVVEADAERFPRLAGLLDGAGYEAKTWSGKPLTTGRVASYGNILFLPKT